MRGRVFGLCGFAVLAVWGCAGSGSAERAADAAAHQIASQAPAAGTPALDIQDSIRAVLAGHDRALSHEERTELETLYRPVEPLWTDITGRPGRNARVALSVLASASTDGLDPADYDVLGLNRRSAALDAVAAPPAADVAAFDVSLSGAVLRYFRHLHLGLIDPRAIGFELEVPAEPHDFPSLLRDAVARDRVGEAAAELAPALVQYRLLRAALGQYRALAASSNLSPLPRHPPVHPGEPYAQLSALYERLVAFGDLSRDTPAPLDGALFAEPFVQAVRRFQVRHGLEPDGIVGAQSHAALQVPPAVRARQIELALERLRWLPDVGDRRFLALNIPMFHLWAWNSVPPSGAPTLGMRAIVGRALGTQTPVFVDEMRAVIFRPYWNVPRSILLHEILPTLTRDPGYMDRQNLEMVRGQGDEGRPLPVTAENIALLRKGQLRLRQRPGPGNALGLVKFDFPNQDNVYMHGTPAQELFNRTRRDFSHGCVRVEDPVTLAEWVLKDEPDWTRDRILAAMSDSKSTSVKLSRPIQVILFYVTAVVMPEDGTVRFAQDLYGHDAKLERALASRRSRK